MLGGLCLGGLKIHVILFCLLGFSLPLLLVPDKTYLLHKQDGKRLSGTKIMWPIYNVNPTRFIYTLAQLYCSALLTLNRLHFCSSFYVTKGYSAFSESASVPPYPINLPTTDSHKAGSPSQPPAVAMYRMGSPLWKFQLPLETQQGTSYLHIQKEIK